MTTLAIIVLSLLLVRRRPTRYGGGGGWFRYALTLVLAMGLLSTTLSVAEWALQSGFLAGLSMPGASIAWLFLLACGIAFWLLAKRWWISLDPWGKAGLRNFRRWLSR